ncbi:MAG: hypothetical protein ABIQ16_07155, partial [Polyangiaceae bacterium]
TRAKRLQELRDAVRSTTLRRNSAGSVNRDFDSTETAVPAGVNRADANAGTEAAEALTTGLPALDRAARANCQYV